jgi:ABC-type dipeptide/oligopeptide/nickel transport system ATPase subunit
VLWNLILIVMDMLKWMANVGVIFITHDISICKKIIIKWILLCLVYNLELTRIKQKKRLFKILSLERCNFAIV